MKRSIMLFSVLALVGLLVVGGTMAWFTSNPDPVTNSFAAGTVEISVNENGFEDVTNVNPGDTHDKEVTVVSSGSKATYVRAQLTPAWDMPGNDGPALLAASGLGPASYEIGDDWVDGEDGWFYYKHILQMDDETTPLITEVEFDGPSMDNTYQGATFTLEVEAQAVQASHEAYMEVWGLSALPAGVEAY